MNESQVRYSIQCFYGSSMPVGVIKHIMKIELLILAVFLLFEWVHVTFTSQYFTNIADIDCLRIFKGSYVTAYFMYCIVIRCKLNTYYNIGLIITRLNIWKWVRLFFWTTIVMHSFGGRIYAFIQYCINKDKHLKNSGLTYDSWHWIHTVIRIFMLVVCIWQIYFIPVIDRCLLKIKEDKNYVGENTKIVQSQKEKAFEPTGKSKKKEIKSSDGNCQRKRSGCLKKSDIKGRRERLKSDCTASENVLNTKKGLSSTTKKLEIVSYPVPELFETLQLSNIQDKNSVKGCLLKSDQSPKDGPIDVNDFEAGHNQSPKDGPIDVNDFEGGCDQSLKDGPIEVNDSEEGCKNKIYVFGNINKKSEILKNEVENDKDNCNM